MMICLNTNKVVKYITLDADTSGNYKFNPYRMYNGKSNSRIR